MANISADEQVLSQSRASIPLHWRELRLLLYLVDIAVIVLVSYLTVRVWAMIDTDFVATPLMSYWFVGHAALWMLGLILATPAPAPGRTGLPPAFSPVLYAGGLVLAVTVLAFFFAPFTFPRSTALLSPFSVAVGLLTWHFFATHIARWGLWTRRVLFLGCEPNTVGSVQLLRAASQYSSYRPVAFLTDEVTGPAAVLGVPVIGRADLLECVRKYRVHEVVVGTDIELGPDLSQRLLECFHAGISVSAAESFYEEIASRVPVASMTNDWYVSFPTMPRRPYFALKRAIDVVLAIAFGVVLSPLIVLIAALVLLDDGTPILFRQVRSGRMGVPFVVHKFRTMRVDAESVGPRWATAKDPRATRFGRLLRPFGLDELPQLWDVLRGSMSLFGPRPERPEFVEQLAANTPLYRARLLVRPGISGWAEVNIPHAEDDADHIARLEYDLYYMKHASLMLDLRIAVHTLAVVLTRARRELFSRPKPSLKEAVDV